MTEQPVVQHQQPHRSPVVVAAHHARARSINAVRRGLGQASAAATPKALSSRANRHSTGSAAAAAQSPPPSSPSFASRQLDLVAATAAPPPACPPKPSITVKTTLSPHDAFAAATSLDAISAISSSGAAAAAAAAALDATPTAAPRSLRTKSPVADLREEAALSASDERPDAHDTDKKKTSSHSRLNLAVLGSSRAGKSTFIRDALDLSPRQHAPHKAKLASITGKLYSIRIFEFTFDQVPLQPDGSCSWPARAYGIPLQRVDGVFILYDPTNGASLDPVARYLSGVQAASTPAALVAAKWDLRPLHRRLGPDQIEQSKLLRDRSLALQASTTQPETAQRCLSALLSAVVQGERSRSSSATSLHALQPRRNTTNTHHYHHRLNAANTARNPRTTDRSRRHGRTASDLVGSTTTTRPPLLSNNSYSSVRTTGFRTAPTTPYQSFETSPIVTLETQDMLPVPQSAGNTSPKSFLDMDEPSTRLSSESAESLDLVSHNHNNPPPHQPALDASIFTLDELASRLLTAPQSDADAKFQTSFLTLYRLFATPLELFHVVVRHFDNVQDPRVFMQALCSPGRDLAVLHQWILAYPGDFARAVIQKRAKSFLVPLKEQAEYVAMAKTLLQNLSSVTADDDTDWARSDEDCSRPSTAHTFLSTSSSIGSDSESFRELDDTPDGSGTRYKPGFGDSDPSLDGPGSLTSSQTTVVSDGAAQKEADVLVPQPTHFFGKAQWHAFLQLPDVLIAREMTRMDKIMFSLIRPRDLVRHVTLAPDARSHFPGTDNVNHMIEHFNHVAYFITNFILFRDKPKHRVLALDKVMRVGRELRKLDNYNSLGAVVAGVRGSAVQRLAQTWDLLGEDRRRDFMKIEILMGTSRGHAAYRIAWENSFGPRIPFLPLHRRDLVAAEQGNRTFASPADADERNAARKRICWRKFEIMGDVLVDLRDAQRTSYSFAAGGLPPGHDEVRALLLNCRISTDDEHLYERSVQLEPGAHSRAVGGAAAGSANESGGHTATTTIGALDMSAVRRRLNPFLLRYGIA